LREGLRYLLELQRLDSEIASRQETLASLPGMRKQFEASLTAAEVKLVSAREDLARDEIGLRQAEGALQDQESLLQRLESQQFQVKDNHAYTALLSEMEHAKTAISECETRILEGMEAVETARAALEAAETQQREIGERLDSEGCEVDAREKRCEGELAQLSAERDQVEPKLDAKILAVYEKVARRKRPAVALVSDEMCVGCRVGIPAQNYIEILKGDRIITCGNCQRILLHPAMVSEIAGSPDSAIEKP
jgi:hypothetical protein